MSDPFLNTDVARTIQRLAKANEAIAEHARRQIGPIQQALAAFQDAAPWLRDLRPRLERMGATFERAFERARPPNWEEEFEFRLLLDRGDIISNEGIPLVWVPDGALVTELTNQETEAARLGVLEGSAEMVVDSCSARMEEITDDRLADPVRGLQRAVDAWHDGHLEASQALATVSLDTTITRVLRLRAWEARERFDRDLEQVALRVVRQSLVLVAVHRSLDQFYPERGDPTPSRYNRHATVHAMSAEQYKPVNALVAMMLTTSLLRETQEHGTPGDAVE